MTSEVKKNFKEMKNNKALGIDNLTIDIMVLVGEESVKRITTISDQILDSKKIPTEWKEAKMIILHNKGDARDIKNYRPVSLLSHMYKLFTRILPKKKKKKKKLEKVLDENQPREQAAFRKGYSTVDHRQTIYQLIEKCHEFKRPLCIGYIGFEKAVDYIEHEAIFKALRSISINEPCITILEDTYTDATAGGHMDNQVSEEIPLLRGVRQGDPISPILFTATTQEVFEIAHLEEKSINIDREKLSNLRFADDVALTTDDVKDMEHQLKTVNEESLKISLKIHKGKLLYDKY